MRGRSRHIHLVLFVALAGLPLVAGMVYAGLYSTGLTGLVNKGWTGDHWAEVLRGGVFWSSLGFSCYIALVSIGLAFLMALGIVLLWVKDLQRGWLSYVLYVPLTLPAMVVAFLGFNFLSKGGLFSRLCYQLGITDSLQAFPEWVNDRWGIGIIAAHVFMATPFFTILLANLFSSERIMEYREAARTLGARPWSINLRVVVPLLWKRSFPTLVLYTLFVMGSYEVPLLLGSQSPQMVSVLAIRKLQKFNLMDIPQAYGISLLYTALVIVVVTVLIGRRKRERI
jgi:putative spermidine/putrescine transport system permease protein